MIPTTDEIFPILDMRLADEGLGLSDDHLLGSWLDLVQLSSLLRIGGGGEQRSQDESREQGS
jgi:hypothetical protein